MEYLIATRDLIGEANIPRKLHCIKAGDMFLVARVGKQTYDIHKLSKGVHTLWKDVPHEPYLKLRNRLVSSTITEHNKNIRAIAKTVVEFESTKPAKFVSFTSVNDKRGKVKREDGKLIHCLVLGAPTRNQTGVIGLLPDLSIVFVPNL